MPDAGVTLTEFAQLAGVASSTIRYHLKQGTLKRRRDGKLNAKDAQLLIMGRQVSAERDAPDPRSARLLKARYASGAVKTRRLKMHIAEAQALVVERGPLEVALRERCDAVTARIGSWPTMYAGLIAELVDVPEATAAQILSEFTNIALRELGNLHEEAERCVGHAQVG